MTTKLVGSGCQYCNSEYMDDDDAQPEQDNTYTYASSLATTIWQKHYIKDSPKWKPLETTDGVLTQIDNMTCGLVREKPTQPEQEPWPEEPFGHMAGGVQPPQRPWVDVQDEEIKRLWIQYRAALPRYLCFAKALLAKSKEKNNG